MLHMLSQFDRCAKSTFFWFFPWKAGVLKQVAN
uniref:Uncharacterized protein n=1 Tax=Anguilla anguilla TaxID=7936 RepID=A0A0E9VJT7_ANGAN